MPERVSRFRLMSSAFDRADENEQEDPKRMIFLSVEGDETERTYFQHLNEHLDKATVQIEVLRHRRGEGYSDPQQVIGLLDEYINVRHGELVPKELPASFREKYPKEVIKAYLEGNDTLDPEEKRALQEELLKIGIDLEYRRYLQVFDNDLDYFAVVIDRDSNNHSRELMQECVRSCEENGYACFVSNPCFGFWLLLHLCDVKAEFSEADHKKMLHNEKVSNHHTVVSAEVSKRAHHTKTISMSKFTEMYYPNIQQAIAHVKEFATDFPELLDNLGSNLPKLFDELGNYMK